MRINVSLPFDRIEVASEFLHGAAVQRLAGQLERSGFYGCTVTDHPCPSGRWLDSGGHHAADPFVLLSLVAAATRTLRLQTGILVLPYRNPFITARAVATLDVFSAGRVTLGVGAGYMKSEYSALGVDYERRLELFDEYIAALRAAWSADEFSFTGSGYDAPGNRILPRPLQKNGPPILIGGNSQQAIRRAVALGDGWCPFFTAPGVARSARTASMKDFEEFARALDYMRECCERAERAQPPEVVLGSVGTVSKGFDPAVMLERLDELQSLGIRTVGIYIHADTLDQWCELAESFSTKVLAVAQQGA